MTTAVGLECLAVAVAHLERQNEEGESIPCAPVGAPRNPSEEENVVFSRPCIPRLPAPSSFAAHPRYVSVDEPVVDGPHLARDAAYEAVGGYSRSLSLPASRLTSDAVPQAGTPATVGAFSAPSMAMSSDSGPPAEGEELRRRILSLDLNGLKTCPVPGLGDPITSVMNNDVLCGRGGETNHHSGNIMFRACVKACQADYIEAKRRDKPYIAQRIVLMVRRMGGRFLKKDRESNNWKDVGNVKAREKTSQALREGAPELRGDVKEKGKCPSKGEDSSVVPNVDPRTHSGPVFHTSFPISKVSETGALLKSCRCMDVDVAVPQPSQKKRRVSLLELADAATSSPRQSSPRFCSSEHLSPQSCTHLMRFPATVSADDDEGRASANTTPKAIKGPRIKILKKRLECDDSV